jgi:hypothetical protein
VLSPNVSEMVPRVGFEPTSPRLQRGAFTSTRCITARMIVGSSTVAATDEIWCAWLDSNEH